MKNYQKKNVEKKKIQSNHKKERKKKKTISCKIHLIKIDYAKHTEREMRISSEARSN